MQYIVFLKNSKFNQILAEDDILGEEEQQQKLRYEQEFKMYENYRSYLLQYQFLNVTLKDKMKKQQNKLEIEFTDRLQQLKDIIDSNIQLQTKILRERAINTLEEVLSIEIYLASQMNLVNTLLIYKNFQMVRQKKSIQKVVFLLTQIKQIPTQTNRHSQQKKQQKNIVISLVNTHKQHKHQMKLYKNPQYKQRLQNKQISSLLKQSQNKILKLKKKLKKNILDQKDLEQNNNLMIKIINKRKIQIIIKKEKKDIIKIMKIKKKNNNNEIILIKFNKSNQENKSIFLTTLNQFKIKIILFLYYQCLPVFNLQQFYNVQNQLNLEYTQNKSKLIQFGFYTYKIIQFLFDFPIFKDYQVLNLIIFHNLVYTYLQNNQYFYTFNFIFKLKIISKISIR
ncbi:hypothetical protein TTHERM_00329750 (macronuclear) [Tetrahymena thermophila SB210]|uniref:Uncharacterized protein n=1 Tax=Tetrahymena thermophila (strain SB210) TaxID=312017 RepID=I7M4D9_TETTS|nr:hypothetical protein TTHERM_00329750 [Tetrahymena thermophila SB210]EAS06295.2 hypothetical protein TTHERM_00329750 [Tetrahymena thermophila SB210]|eukprot:XP_001026540.2 hypothetical protein TTHERM_00329750 [Tetrahymena thermophila SB210]